MDNLKKNIEKVIHEIDEVVEMFYQQKTKEAYTRLDSVLADLLQVVDPIHGYEEEHPEEGVDSESLTDALSAMEEKDAILTADVLKYEVNEKLETIMNAIQ
mgnify:CR=1 FL=1